MIETIEDDFVLHVSLRYPKAPSPNKRELWLLSLEVLLFLGTGSQS